MSELLPDVRSLLAAQGINAPDRAMPHNGFSGARLTRVGQGAERFVLKRISYAEDWIMRETGDVGLREAQFAVSPLMARLPRAMAVPSLSAARDGSGAAILMRDVSPWLLPDDRPASVAQVDALLAAMAAMHAAFWDQPLADARVSWCGVRERLMLLSPIVGKKLVEQGRDFGVAAGWRAFHDHAPPEAQRLAARLFEDPARVLQAAAALPPTLLHGDIKLANVAIDPDGGRVWLFDWALVMRGPVALDLAWFPAVNTPQIPWSVDETIDRYCEHLRVALGAHRRDASWPEQRAVAAIGTLMLMGWAKALDHEAGRPHELAGICSRALAAAPLLGL